VLIYCVFPKGARRGAEATKEASRGYCICSTTDGLKVAWVATANSADIIKRLTII
jgi:hypothetical protein